MTNSLMRGVDEALLRAPLKKRAETQSLSAEAEHRQILEKALSRPNKRGLAKLLTRIPEVGTDADFERDQTDRAY